MLKGLDYLEILVLEHLPGTPNGLSVPELADGLLGDASPPARGQIRGALRSLELLLGGLAVTRGDDTLGHADVELWGLPPDTLTVVRRIFAVHAAWLRRQRSLPKAPE